MCNGSIMDKLISFALPLMLSGILQLMFNAVDIVVVGRFSGSQSLAAVGSTTALINVFTNLFIGISLGTNVLAARFYGAGKTKEMSETVHTSIALALISGVAMAVIGLIFSRWSLEVMGTPEDVQGLSVIYLRIYFLGIIANLVYNMGAAILRAVGDSKRPLYFLSAAGVLNVVLNLIFVIVLHMDVAGVALATILSETLSAVLILNCLCRTDGPCHLNIRKLYIQKDQLIRMLRIGLPAGIQSGMFSFSNVLIQSSINSFGSVVMAGSSASASIENFVYISMNGVHQATVSFVSQNNGAGKPERINKILFSCLGLVTVTGILMGGTANLFSRQLLSIYSTDPAVISAGQIRMFWIAMPYFLCGIMEVVMGVMRGLGYAITPMLVAVSGACLYRIIWLATIFTWFPTQQVLYLCYATSWILTTLIHTITYLYARKHHPLFTSKNE